MAVRASARSDCLIDCASAILFLLAHFFKFSAPAVDAFFDFFLHALVGRLVVALGGAKVILRDEMVGMVVGVVVAFAVAEAFGAFVMSIAEVFGDGEGAAGFDV